MGGSLLGSQLRLMTFGESHGVAMGGVLDGFPAGIPVDYALLRREMQRRRPRGQSFETARKEADEVEILSGVLDGITLGTPIAFLIRNQYQRSSDYLSFSRVYRPGHADYTWDKKYGFRDARGGGRASARETVARVAAGALAKMLLQRHGVVVYAFVHNIGGIVMPGERYDYPLREIEASAVRCPDSATSQAMEALLDQVAREGDSVGGVVTCVVKHCPVGVGEPVFAKLDGVIAQAVMSIPAIKGVEMGRGFAAAAMRGSEHNDPFQYDRGKISPVTNNAGGVAGGIATGEDIVLRAAVKPVSSIKKPQHTVDHDGKAVDLAIKGRHDVCVAPRVVPVVEAMVSLAVADLLQQQTINRHYISQ
ncbi:MAG: chorismate synthase [Bacteroidetes bacterium]|nr:MAG: chorismate synthase [Bacteroidota bacterium]